MSQQRRTLVLNPEIFQNFQEALQLRPALDKIESAATIIILKKYVNKLIIVKGMLNGKDKKEESGYSSLALRVNQRVKVVPPEDKVPDRIAVASYKKRQVNLVLDIFEELILELDVQGTYTYLEYLLCCENAKLFDNLTVKQESRDLTRYIAYLRDKNQKDKSNFQKTQSVLLESSGPCLEQAVVNVYVEEHLGGLYAEMRENASKEKSQLKCQDRENEVEATIDGLCTDIADESIIHQEIHYHLSSTVAELVEKLEYWTDKYNGEVEKLDVDLLQLTSKREDVQEKYKNMLTEFTRRQEILREMREIADEQERQFQRFIQETRAAVKIQTWWKKILFQRNLKKKQSKKNKGPNKPKSKRKNK